jgi:hypothetical protein
LEDYSYLPFRKPNLKIDTTTIKRYLSPNAYRDLDTFLEELPMRAGQSIIIAGVAAWLMAGMAVVFVTMQANHIMGLRADILKAEALKPTVPIISKVPVDGEEVATFVKKLGELYPQVNVSSTTNRIEIRGASTDKYGAFREAVGHAFNGGKDWRLNVEELCVGRECKNNLGLFGAFSVNRLRVDKPAG